MNPLTKFKTFAATLPLEIHDELLIEEELENLEAIQARSETAAIFYEHYLEIWLGIFFGGYGGMTRGDAIACAYDKWDEGFWAAPGDWVQIPSKLKLAHEGCQVAWTHAWDGPVLPLPPFGYLMSDPAYCDCD